MSRDSRQKPADQAAWLRAAFWDEVEVETEAIDWADFVDFLEADQLPIPVRAEFKEELRARLQRFVKARYTS